MKTGQENPVPSGTVNRGNRPQTVLSRKSGNREKTRKNRREPVRNRLDSFPTRIVGSCFEPGKFSQEHPVLVGRGTPTRSRSQPSPATTPVRRVKRHIYPPRLLPSPESVPTLATAASHTPPSRSYLVSLVSCALPLPAPEDPRPACPRPPRCCVLGCWPRLAASTHQTGTGRVAASRVHTTHPSAEPVTPSAARPLRPRPVDGISDPRPGWFDEYWLLLLNVTCFLFTIDLVVICWPMYVAVRTIDYFQELELWTLHIFG
jgi:hypothetical protein